MSLLCCAYTPSLARATRTHVDDCKKHVCMSLRVERLHLSVCVSLSASHVCVSLSASLIHRCMSASLMSASLMSACLMSACLMSASLMSACLNLGATSLYYKQACLNLAFDACVSVAKSMPQGASRCLKLGLDKHSDQPLYP